MFPKSSSCNITDKGWIDVKHLRYFLLMDFIRRNHAFDLFHLAKVQFTRMRVMSTFGYWAWTPALFCHILAIVGRCSNKKMIWISAWRVIAMVQNMHPFWDRPFMNHPGHTMRPLSFIAKFYRSISACIFRTNPFPTFISFYDFFKEPIFYFLDFIKKFGGRICRIFIHWELPPDVMPPVDNVNAGAFYWLDSTKFQGRIS